MPSGRPPIFWPALALLVAAKLALQAPLLPRYGIFRDELYYLACADHLAFGYVDHPPLIAVVAWLGRAVFGAEPAGFRWLALGAGVGTLVLTILLARALGGGRWAQTLAGLSLLVGGYFLAVSQILTMNAFEPLIWTGLALLLLSALRSGRTASWLGFGALAGLGLLNKHSLAFFGFALVVALALSTRRRVLLDKRAWAALGLALAIWAPNLIWLGRHDFPTLEFMHNARTLKNAPLSPLVFLREQILQMHPATAPIWIAGIVHSLLRKDEPNARFVGGGYLALLALFLITGAKPYYLAPYYPIALAAGGVACERLIAARPAWRYVAQGWAGFALASGALLAPLALPLLAPARLSAYVRWLGLTPELGERQAHGPLPQLFADMFGWREKAEAVAAVFHSLPEPERRAAIIVASNYGQAGAIDHFGPSLGLPRATSGHNSYFLWGGPNQAPAVVIALGLSEERLRAAFDEVAVAAVTDHPYAMPKERRLSVFVCRRPRKPWPELYAELKRYI